MARPAPRANFRATVEMQNSQPIPFAVIEFSLNFASEQQCAYTQMPVSRVHIHLVGPSLIARLLIE